MSLEEIDVLIKNEDNGQKIEGQRKSVLLFLYRVDSGVKRWDELFDPPYRLSHETIRRIIHKLL